MVQKIFTRLGWFVLLLLLQVLLFGHIHLFGYATPMPYVYFLIILSLDTPRWLYLVSAFALGLAIDIFSCTPGTPRFGTGTEAVVEKSPQVAVQVGSGENAFEGNFHRLFDSDAETFEAIFDEMFIGVLAVRPVGDHAATLGTEAVDKFVAQADSGGIGVDGDDDFFQVLEVGFHETVEP